MRVRVSKIRSDEEIYRGVHPLYGQIAGYFSGETFMAHQGNSSGGFFNNGVWAKPEFALNDVVVATDAEWY
jgi:hypothetical protein